MMASGVKTVANTEWESCDRLFLLGEYGVGAQTQPLQCQPLSRTPNLQSRHGKGLITTKSTQGDG